MENNSGKEIVELETTEKVKLSKRYPLSRGGENVQMETLTVREPLADDLGSLDIMEFVKALDLPALFQVYNDGKIGKQADMEDKLAQQLAGSKLLDCVSLSPAVQRSFNALAARLTGTNMIFIGKLRPVDLFKVYYAVGKLLIIPFWLEFKDSL